MPFEVIVALAVFGVMVLIAVLIAVITAVSSISGTGADDIGGTKED